MKFYATRLMECAIEIEADTREEAILKLPRTPEELAEVADVAFASLWAVQADGERSDIRNVSDDDIDTILDGPIYGEG